MGLTIRITGKTQLIGILGYPVSHTLSPAMQNAAFASRALDYCYLPFSVHPRDLGRALEGLRALGCRGLNITIPHKRAIIPHLDGLSREARLIGAVNTVEFRRSRAIGHNTDGPGFARAYRAELGKTLKGRRVLLIGAGGAARAVAVQLLLEKAKAVMIANRTSVKARELVRSLRKIFPGKAISAIPLAKEVLKKEMPEVDIVINATSLGMHPRDKCPLPPNLLRRSLTVCDLIYHPPETRLIREARAAGARTQNGLGMLLHQGAQAFEIWTGRRPDLGVMRGALVREIAGERAKLTIF